DALYINLPFGGILIFRQHALHITRDLIVRSKENRDPSLARQVAQESLRFVRKSELLVARQIPAPVTLEPQVIDHDRDDEKDRNLNENIQTNPDAMNLLRFCWG